MEFETRAIHVGQEPDEQTGAVMPPIYATSTFAQIRPGETRGYDYTRSGNPNFTRLGRTLASLEGGRHATVFANGMAAITAVISTLSSGDLVLAEENVYGCTFRIFARVFEKFGVRVQYVDFTERASLDSIAREAPALVWLESPTNPMLKILDIAAISRVASAQGIPVLVDNTFASPYFQRPLELGATLSLSSTTKYVNGHSDCLGGVVVTNDDEWQEKMLFAQKAVGLNPSPFDAWLVQRGVKTLALRMQKHHANALAIAERLEGSRAVKWVRHPFLPSHPQYEVARRQMHGGSGIVTLELDADLERTTAFVSGLGIFALAESLGGIESLVDHPASMTHASIPRPEREKVGIFDGLVRLSVGIEDVDDLIGDLDRGLRHAGLPGLAGGAA
ncbi:MAG: PLP-dependent transferase [Spirochaetaceae bacterium]|nr:PLP-dependent transferase [Myxococcales bacterium]MCB9724243.1 PLP-dependent transferase [Spirochaetaceae bacterium]HPG25050.1 PLP-dependent aspartate aminotransferase family protein [Myxococcota bacterium]